MEDGRCGRCRVDACVTRFGRMRNPVIPFKTESSSTGVRDDTKHVHHAAVKQFLKWILSTPKGCCRMTLGHLSRQNRVRLCLTRSIWESWDGCISKLPQAREEVIRMRSPTEAALPSRFRPLLSSSRVNFHVR